MLHFRSSAGRFQPDQYISVHLGEERIGKQKVRTAKRIKQSMATSIDVFQFRL